ncbi:TcfC E-set like domain-containing protein [Microbulbifer sp. OS29]|uniref:TcfC E-set like domain-containing protein n=1 Tax=Microbulbifer okhotskensis TaxID=2926617 RepID=A0A9X2ETR8_9GAMM|nr:TcfC E-set like domain-containing protein [Microbulbifer okhotskensis]MCO1335693.1 TcfC E-set like domain-containing protein [Microbulbifer okhotskensis]
MTIKMIKGVASILCLLLVVSTGGFAETELASESKKILETGVPSGFEDLSQPQFIVADLYYGSQQIGTAQITVYLRHIEFNDPITVFNLLPESLDPILLKQLLSQRQDKNSHRLCQNTSQMDCGYLIPEDFAVIYDDDQYRLDIYFSPNLLPQEEAIAAPYLPSASSGFSLIQNLSATWAGVSSKDYNNNYSATFNGNTIVGFGENALRSQWHYTDVQGHQISSLHWTKDFRGKTYSAGLFQPQGNYSYFNTSQAIFGIEYRNSYRTRTDLSHQQGALIEVNMPVRGRVEIYRENRLIHTELLDAGNRVVNTTTLPSGAYEIDIRTFDESGRPLKNFSDFFAKDFYLPAPGEWHWSLLAGLPTNIRSYQGLPEYYREGIARAYLGRRISDNIALFSSFSAAENQQVVEIGARWVGSRLELSPNFVADSKGQQGYRLDALFTTPYFTLSASSTKLSKAEAFYLSENYPLLRTGFRQRNIGLQSHILGGNISFRYSERESLFTENEHIFNSPTNTSNSNKLTTLSYQRTILKRRNWFGNLTISYNDADGEKYSSIHFLFRYRTNHWQHSASIRHELGNNLTDTPHKFAFNSRWFDHDLWAPQVEQAIGGEVSENSHHLESHTRISGHQGFLNTSISLSDEESNRTTNYLGTFSTNIITTGTRFAWGGERALESAIIVDIDGSDRKEFEVLVDGKRHGYAMGGGKSVINLPAFQSYDISLRPLDNGFFEYREKSQLVTLYPGNVTETNYKIQPLYVIVGRIISYGNGLPETLITIDDHQVTTDQFGVFQLEVPIDIQGYSNLEVKWLDCRIEVQVEDSGENWINLGTLQQSDAYCLPAFKVSKHNEQP